jgi:hypothetical protein
MIEDPTKALLKQPIKPIKAVAANVTNQVGIFHLYIKRLKNIKLGPEWDGTAVGSQFCIGLQPKKNVSTRDNDLFGS